MGGYVWKSMVVNPCEKARHHRIIGKHQNVHIDGGHQHIQLRIPLLGQRHSKMFYELPDGNALLLFPSTELSDCETLTVNEVG